MNIKITYRRTSALRMRIGANGDLLVSAPYGYPAKDIERFIGQNSEWVERARAKSMARRESRDDFFARLSISTKQEARDVARRINELIPPLVNKHAELMGVTPGIIKYRATRTKLGHCRKATGEIMFSVYLLLFPEWIAEHVVVHELAHLIEPNHGPRFYALMDKHFPRWKQARQMTRQIMRGHNTEHEDEE